MTDPNLMPDPEALAKWRELPQNQPSKDALPPLTGGLQPAWLFVIILAVLLVFGLLAQGHFG
jgi:hypothetical protein